MALTTYSELKTAIASYLHRTYLTTQIPDFITLLESRMNRKLRLRVMESDETVTFTSGTRTIALPTGYIEPISLGLVITNEPRDYLNYLLPKQLDLNANSNSARRPQYYTINGTNIEFPSPADQTYTMNFRMVKAFALSDASPTNYLLTNYPDLYLYGAMMEAMPYINNDNRMALWENRYNTAFEEIQNKEARSKALVRLVTESPLRGIRGFNVYAGE